ncbi:hypothetical protein [Prosthecobacter sp.]|uniref:hypothetical protein n=1 Tax=Prosthecobacter sp. TaxID=1965333 RepID=UPI0037852EA5
MSTISLPLLRDFSDRFSPIVVKELRQGLRTRFFTSALILFHTFIILLLVTATLDVPVEAVNGIFWGIAGLMLLVVLPLRGFGALHSEAADGTLDMLTLTSIPSFRILSGKWAALCGQSLLVAGSILPYMVARYFFGGVEILREVMALCVLLLGSGLITAGLLAFSSQASLVLRIFLTLCIGAGAMPLAFFTAYLVSASEADTMLREFFLLSFWEQFGIIGGVLAVVVYAVYYFLALGSSRIAPPSENHSTRKRLVALAAHGALLITGLLLACFNKDSEVAMWAFIPLMFLTFIVCMDVMTEEMPRFPNALAFPARRRPLERLAAQVLHPGWVSGVWFAAILSGMAMLLISIITLRSRHWDWDDGPPLFMLCMFSASFVPVIIRINRSNMFANWWVWQLVSVIFGIMMTTFLHAVDARDFGVFGIVTPITALFGMESINYSIRDKFLLVAAGCSSLWMLAALVRARLNASAYTTLEREAQRLAALEPASRTHDAA